MTSIHVHTTETQSSNPERETIVPVPTANDRAPLVAGDKLIVLSFLIAVALFFLISIIDLVASVCR